MSDEQEPTPIDSDWLIEIDYTNHRGERGVRVVRPIELYFGTSEFHPGKLQHLMRAWDIAKSAERTFAMKDIHSWRRVAPQ